MIQSNFLNIKGKGTKAKVSHETCLGSHSKGSKKLHRRMPDFASILSSALTVFFNEGQLHRPVVESFGDCILLGIFLDNRN